MNYNVLYERFKACEAIDKWQCELQELYDHLYEGLNEGEEFRNKNIKILKKAINDFEKFKSDFIENSRKHTEQLQFMLKCELEN